jgi:hypothetical protein
MVGTPLAIAKDSASVHLVQPSRPMSAKPTTVTELLAALPEDRRRIIKGLRTVIRKNIDKPGESPPVCLQDRLGRGIPEEPIP